MAISKMIYPYLIMAIMSTNQKSQPSEKPAYMPYAKQLIRKVVASVRRSFEELVDSDTSHSSLHAYITYHASPITHHSSQQGASLIHPLLTQCQLTKSHMQRIHHLSLFQQSRQ
eukprot:GHVN01016409.1.p1 GENE.GHVN01016409.1~~GHVN01016409.1.p1  ORF type:complete len:114 (-),score=9.48 GHVN01016409.1:52-393(-)